MTCSFPETQFLQLPGWIRYNIFVATISACFADTLVSLARPAPKCLSLSAENSHCHCVVHVSFEGFVGYHLLSHQLRQGCAESVWVLLPRCFLAIKFRSQVYLILSLMAFMFGCSPETDSYQKYILYTVLLNIWPLIYTIIHAPRRIVKCPIKYIIIHRYAVACSSKWI